MINNKANNTESKEFIDVEFTEIESNQNEVITVDKADIVEAQLPKEEAEKLTEDIKATTTALYLLLKKAHDSKAWVSLGYKSWTEYIEKEFEFSRARSYQLINQANVIEEIHEASGVPLYITEREARDIKKRLPEITQKLQEDLKNSDLSEEETEEKVREIIKEESKEDIDNADNFKGKSTDDGWDDPNEFDEGEDSSPGFSDNGSYSLTDDDKFYYENLQVTLKIFESMPNAVMFGEKIKKSTSNRKELIKLAEDSYDWINKLLGQIK